MRSNPAIATENNEEMAAKIRLARHGSKKRPFYRIVAASSRAPRDGRFIEQLGHYDPTREPVELKFDLGKLEAWIRRGAQPSETVAQLMKRAGWKGLPKTSDSTAPSAEG
jgi:small subunit ribosomal protein S16